MAWNYETCLACDGTGIEKGFEHLPESRIGGHNDCHMCFGMGSVLPMYNIPSMGNVGSTKTRRKRVTVEKPNESASYYCHLGCITAGKSICVCRCEGINHGVVKEVEDEAQNAVGNLR